MQRDKFEAFVDKFHVYPIKDDLCQSDKDLAKYAEQSTPEWTLKVKEHVEGCQHCGGIFSLLKEAQSPEGHLHEFIRQANENAARAVTEKPAPFWTYLSALFPTHKPSLNLAAAGLVAAAIVFWVVGQKTAVFNPPAELAAVTFEEDKYQKTVELLETSLAQLSTSSISDEERHRQIADINSRLAEVKEVRLQSPEQRGELAELVARYQSELVRQGELRNTPHNKIAPAATQAVESQGDAEIVAALYNIYDDAVKKKPAAVAHAPNASDEVKQAEAVRNVAEQFDVVFGENEVTLKDRTPEMEQATQESIRSAFKNFADSKNFTVNYEFAGRTATFSPNQPISVKESSPVGRVSFQRRF